MPTTTFAFLPDGLNLLSLFDQAFAQCAQIYTPVTIAPSGGTHNVLATDYADLLINGSGASSIQLPAAASRTNQPQGIIDIAGNAATFNITILPFGTEKIRGASSLIIENNYGGFTLWPISSGGWYLK